MLVKMATSKEVEELREQFQTMDKDGSGMILASELNEIIRNQKLNMSAKDITAMICEVDY